MSSSSCVKTLMISRLPYAAAAFFGLVFPRGDADDALLVAVGVISFVVVVGVIFVLVVLVVVGEDFLLLVGSKYASMSCWPVRPALLSSSAL